MVKCIADDTRNKLAAISIAWSCTVGYPAGYNFNEEDIGTLHFHRIIEAFKFAYGQRHFLGDPDFSQSVKLVCVYMYREQNSQLYTWKLMHPRHFWVLIINNNMLKVTILYPKTISLATIYNMFEYILWSHPGVRCMGWGPACMESQKTDIVYTESLRRIPCSPCLFLNYRSQTPCWTQALLRVCFPG